MKMPLAILSVSLFILSGTVLNAFAQKNIFNNNDQLKNFPENTIERFAKAGPLENKIFMIGINF